MEAGGPLSARAFQTSQTRWLHRGASAAEEPRGARARGRESALSETDDPLLLLEDFGLLRLYQVPV